MKRHRKYIYQIIFPLRDKSFLVSGILAESFRHAWSLTSRPTLKEKIAQIMTANNIPTDSNLESDRPIHRLTRFFAGTKTHTYQERRLP